MNQILELIHSRKSVRAYTEREILPVEKRSILEAALQAPSAGNMNLYTILDITDQALKERLALTCDNQPFIAKAKMILIFCADYRRWYDVFCKYEETVRKPAHGDLMLAEADAIIAAQNAVIAAESLGIGSCYIGDITENFEIHRELLKLPQYVVPAAMVVFGYPTQQQLKREKPRRFKLEDVVYENGYDAVKAGKMEAMLIEREEKTEEEFAEWLKRFCKRKWNSDFSREMSRSCKVIINDWCGNE